jgi:F-type H+-transporting ATPase subunit gamma
MEKTTKAMKMVASVKLRRAKLRVTAAGPYAETITRMLRRLAAKAGDYHHPLLDARGDHHYLAVLLTADKGLCGAYNTNLIKAAQRFMRDNADKEIDLVTIGRKGRDFFRRRQIAIAREYINVTARTVDHQEAAGIARDLIEDFTAPETTLDKVFLIYNEFTTALSQRVTIKQLLPIEAEELGGSGAQNGALVDYIYEQPPEEIFGGLLPKYIETQVFYALLESSASEHGARMTAMDAASKNAVDVIDSLTLRMNRERQASITNEIIEVVSGAGALRS